MRLALVLLAACNAAPASGFAIDGNVVASAIQQQYPVFVGWRVATGSVYAFGGGTGTRTTFTVDLVGDPPPQAISSDGVAVGVVAPGGPYADGAMVTLPSLGQSSDYAVIWKSGTAQNPTYPWEASFGASYSCAHCVRGGAGSLDSYELTACANVTIVVPTGTPCAWY